MSDKSSSVQCSVIKDSWLGLQWASPKGQSMDHYEAEDYAKGLTLDGGGWRLPTRSELIDLYKSFNGNADPAFDIDEKWAWTNECLDLSSAYVFNFKFGNARPVIRDASKSGRVLVVRPRR